MRGARRAASPYGAHPTWPVNMHHGQGPLGRRALDVEGQQAGEDGLVVGLGGVFRPPVGGPDGLVDLSVGGLTPITAS